MRDLTYDELAVLNLLGDAATVQATLPESRPADREEFVRAIHAAQNIILARPGTEVVFRAY